MVLKKVIQVGNSRAVTVPREYQLGDYVDVEITPVEIRKVNKEPAQTSGITHQEFTGENSFLMGCLA